MNKILNKDFGLQNNGNPVTSNPCKNKSPPLETMEPIPISNNYLTINYLFVCQCHLLSLNSKNILKWLYCKAFDS